jgi:hypothetical protein
MGALGRMRSFRGLLENAAGVLEKCSVTCGERHPTPVACIWITCELYGKEDEKSGAV